jgi:tripartite-type tricarboxylate transporter receptor subunit TctC
VVVENKPGADGLLAVADFLGARDGHTILFGFTTIVTVNPLLHDKLPYDPLRDIVPISPAVDDFITIAASPSLGVNSLSELVDLARKKPDAINYASVPGGGHFGIIDFQRTNGIAMTFVPYRNPIASITDLIEGRIQIAIMPLSVVLGHAQAGKLTLLAVTSDKRSPAAPDVPTTAEQGSPRFRGLGGLGFFAPKDMPTTQRDFIAEEIAAIVNEPQIQERMINLGYASHSARPEEFEKMLAEQSAWYKSIAPERNQ